MNYVQAAAPRWWIVVHSRVRNSASSGCTPYESDDDRLIGNRMLDELMILTEVVTEPNASRRGLYMYTPFPHVDYSTAKFNEPTARGKMLQIAIVIANTTGPPRSGARPLA